MKLIIEGDVNRYYVQTLCLLYFPGEKFSESEEVTPLSTQAYVRLDKDENGVCATARITWDGKTAESECKEPYRAPYSEQRIVKLAVGTAFYQAGKKLFGFSLPWGIMTGVRPAKIAMELYGQGMRTDEVRKTLTHEYFVNPKKAALLARIARNEMRLIKGYHENTCSLYISIPFCPSRCAYCSFVAYSTKRLLSLIPDYLKRLQEEIAATCAQIRALGLKVASVYIGGGTPSILTEKQLFELLSCINRNLEGQTPVEYTLEAGRPDTITKKKLQVAKECGVNRISINPQTLNDKVLAYIGRAHTTEDFYRAFHIARQSGIPYINTDLIAGLPGDSFDGFSQTVDAIMQLAPENITVHTFCVKKAADIVRSESTIYSRTGGDTGKSVDYSQLQASFHGYIPYYIYRQKNAVGNLENVGFSQKGAEGLYNIFMMEEIHSIFGCGAGAVTKLVAQEGGRIERIFMPKYPYEYLAMEADAQIERQRKIADFYTASQTV